MARILCPLMSESLLLIPIALPIVAALLAWAMGHPALQARVSVPVVTRWMALLPLAGCITVIAALMQLEHGQVREVVYPWMPELGMSFRLYFDHLAGLFAVLVTGIGTLVVLYAGYYFTGEQSSYRFMAYLFLFMASMTGLVLAGDLITLFVFWEGTSITSFLLIGYKIKDPASRSGAFRSLVITGGGGIALLVGAVLIAAVTGGTDYVTILSSAAALKAADLYPAIVLLVGLGCFAKSAQIPFHAWLPNAMTAPTPASTYLHSATMVKAGVYLLARLNPALGGDPLWFWMLSLVGMGTMVLGAWQGLKQRDIKGLLAYSTICQLGVLVMLAGQDSPYAFKALVIGITAHAFYKGALFLIAGIVDHAAHTRDMDKLGGLSKSMRLTAIVATLAALSMAGLPPMYGFLAKETLLATALEGHAAAWMQYLMVGAIVLTGALLLAQSAVLIWDTFFRAPADPHHPPHGHEPPLLMLLAPALPAVLSLLICFVPPPGFVPLLTGAAENAAGVPVKVSLALWHGINLPLILSVVAMTVGALMVWQRRGFFALQRGTSIPERYIDWYGAFLRVTDGAAWLMTRAQNGRLYLYLLVMMVGAAGIVYSLATLPMPGAGSFPLEHMPYLRAMALLLALAAAVVAMLLRRDLYAIIALGGSGLSITLLFILEPAPDVALVMVVVDILTVVILILALGHLPPKLRAEAGDGISAPRSSGGRLGVAAEAVMCLVAGAFVAAIVFAMIDSRPRESSVTPFYQANAKTLVGSSDIVGAIVIDFRGFDTLIEISVFGCAGLGAYQLLRFASRKHEDKPAGMEHLLPAPRLPRSILGIGRYPTSPFVQALAVLLLPLCFSIAAVHAMYGHGRPGDGFTGGVICSLGVAFWYIAFGYHESRRTLTWLRPAALLASGVLLTIFEMLSGVYLGKGFQAPVDYAELMGFAHLLPYGFSLSSSFLFEVGIGLTVLGSASLMIDELGRPEFDDDEAKAGLLALDRLTRSGEITA